MLRLEGCGPWAATCDGKGDLDAIAQESRLRGICGYLGVSRPGNNGLPFGPCPTVCSLMIQGDEHDLYLNCIDTLQTDLESMGVNSKSGKLIARLRLTYSSELFPALAA